MNILVRVESYKFALTQKSKTRVDIVAVHITLHHIKNWAIGEKILVRVSVRIRLRHPDFRIRPQAIHALKLD